MVSLYHVILASLFALLGNCAQPKLVYRTDTRNPTQIHAAGGFTTLAHKNGHEPDVSLYNHLAIGKNAQVSANDGYVATSRSYALCAEQWVGKYSHGTGNAYVYTIAATRNFIDVVATMKGYCPYAEEEEFAALGSIPWRQIEGWVQFENHQLVSSGKNPDFQASAFANEEAGGAQYKYALFPEGHKAWKKSPWNAYKNSVPESSGSSGPSGGGGGGGSGGSGGGQTSS